MYEAKSGLNTITLRNHGKRYVRFADGQVIEYNFAFEKYSGTLMGAMRVQTKGRIDWVDRENEISAHI